MKTLTLIRHATSSQDFPLLGDAQRPLSARGRSELPRQAARLAADLGGEPVAIVASPATRTLVTAQGYAEALGLADDAIRLEPRIYEASSGTLLHLVNTLPETDEHVLLVGHNPGFSDLARVLADDELPFRELPPCGCLSLRFGCDDWASLQPGSGRLWRWYAP